jgi:UrcA family protein
MRTGNTLLQALMLGGMIAGPAMAQTPAPPPATASEPMVAQPVSPESDIVVEAPLLLPVPRENLPTETPTNALASVRIYVLYRDLDLTLPDDAKRLMARVEATARQACGYLDMLSPLDDDAGCIARAAASAAPAAKAAIVKAAVREDREKEPLTPP